MPTLPRMRWLSPAFLALSCMGAASAGENPAELGLVEWGRDLDAAKREAGSSEKPVLLLFQEIPG